MDPISGQVITGDVQAETRQVLNNIKSILEGCGASMRRVVRCGVYLIDADDFQAMNEVYAEFFGDAKPARTTIIVAALPLRTRRSRSTRSRTWGSRGRQRLRDQRGRSACSGLRDSRVDRQPGTVPHTAA